MRIGLISGEYPPMKGGVGAYTQIIARTLAEQGHSPYVFTSQAGTQSTQGVHLTADVNNWKWLTARRIMRWIDAHQLSATVLQYQTAAYQMSPYIHFLPNLLRAQAPFVTTFHDLRVPYLFPKASGLREWIVRHLADTSSGVIATNHEDYTQLMDHRHAALIPIGSNILTQTPSDANARDFVRADSNDLVLAFFGFVNRQKGLEDILAAMVNLREQGITTRLLMIGDRIGTSDPTNAAYATQIDSLIAQQGLTHQVKWTGYLEDADVQAYLTTADAVVLPYRDGASYRRGTLMAAIHYGCTIVTTLPQVPIPDFIDGENLLMVPSGDTQALTAVLIRLYNAPALHQTLRSGTLRLSRLFAWDAIAADYVDFLQRIIEDSV